MCHDCPPEVSTITVVALTTATATLPGSRSSSRTASALINETTVKGPHCISTCAITLSVTTLVTSPTKRLRAELATVSGSLGAAAAFARANSASTSPAMTFRPDWSWLADRLPSSIQRRTLSSLTPNNSAASRTRINATAASYPQMRTDWSVSAAVADLLCLGELPFGVEACPFLARPDGHVDIGPLGPQRSDVRLLARCACERVPAKEPAGVLPGDLVDVGVVGAGRVQFGQDLLRRIRPEAVGVRVVALPRDDVDPDLVSQLQRGLVGDIAGQRMLTEHIAGQLVPEVAAQPLADVSLARADAAGDGTAGGAGAVGAGDLDDGGFRQPQRVHACLHAVLRRDTVDVSQKGSRNEGLTVATTTQRSVGAGIALHAAAY